jgi:hypothetical protein
MIPDTLYITKNKQVKFVYTNSKGVVSIDESIDYKK